MKDLKVLGVCGGQGALLFPFRDKLIGNIEPRGVFHTSREEQWKANFKGIPFLKGYELPEDWLFRSMAIIARTQKNTAAIAGRHGCCSC